MSTRVLIQNFQSPGDILMLTAAVRDLRAAHPGIRVNVQTTCPELWENNPYLDLSISERTPDVKIIRGEYKLIHKSGQLPYHFIHGFRKDLEKKLNLIIPPSSSTAAVFLKKEDTGPGPMEELGHIGPYWIINTGGKKDYTAKWWNPNHAQAVVDHFKDRIMFVQAGGKGEDHWHPSIDGAMDMVGRTTLRGLMRLVWHSQGIICPVTMMMHLSAAIPSKYGGIRPCVVTAGGREPASWEAYNGHFYLSKVGALPCSMNGPCWKAKATMVQCKQEIDEKRTIGNICENRVELDRLVDGEPLQIAKCMDMTKPSHIISIIEDLLETGRIHELQKSHISGN
jgi:ADP-heptose:LPS heptosyltransferase